MSRSRALIVLTVLAVAPVAIAADAPRVAVTVKPVHALVAQVMEGVGEPVLIIDGSASPHTFTLKPSVARAIQSADVFVRVSEELEPFTHKLVYNLPSTVKLVTLAETSRGVTLLDRRTAGTFEAHEHSPEHTKEHANEHDANEHDAGPQDDHEHEDAHGKDGHIWLDPENAKAIVTAVAATLSEKFPASAQIFAANADKARMRLDALSRDIATELAPVKGKPFVVFHDAYQYFENRFAMQAAGSVTLSPDQQPSAKRLTEVRRKIASLGAVCVFAEPGFQPNLLAAVTEGTNAHSGSLDPEGITLSPGRDLYDLLMKNLARALRSCLSASP